MARLLHRFFPKYTRKSATTFLAFCWISGFLLGLTLSVSAGGFSASQMRSAATGSVSIVSLLGTCLLPFLISAIAVYLSKPGFLFPLAFLRAAVFAFVSMGITVSFGSSGWLFYHLLMFCDIGSMVLLYLYMLRHIDGLRRFSLSGSIPYIAALFFISSFDYCIVAPFLAQLV